MKKEVVKNVRDSYLRKKASQDKTLKEKDESKKRVTFIIDNPNTEEQTQRIATYFIQRAVMSAALECVDDYIQSVKTDCM